MDEIFNVGVATLIIFFWLTGIFLKIAEVLLMSWWIVSCWPIILIMIILSIIGVLTLIFD